MATQPIDGGNARTQPESPLLVAALAYAAQGIPVFPVVPRDKRPLTEHGLLDATTDAATLRAWWRKWRRANIGVPTGRASGWLVFDVDTKAGATYDTLARLGSLPRTLTAQTGSGGLHLVFRYPERGEVRNSASRIAPGVDVRGEGGYIVVAPSRHATGGQYEWTIKTDLAPCPGWLVKLASEKPAPASRPLHQPVTQASADDRDAYWLAWALARSGAGTGDETGFLLAQQLLLDPHVRNADGVLAEYASRATLDTSDPFDTRSIDRWLSSAARSKIVAGGEPAKGQHPKVTPMRQRTPTPPQTEGTAALQPPPPTTESEPKAFPLTELGNAERLYAAHGQDIRFCKALGFCAWDGTRWRRDAELTVRRWAKETVRAMYAEAAALAEHASQTGDASESKQAAGDSIDLMKWARKSETDRMLSAMLSLVREMVEIDPSIFDAHPMLLNVRNGTIHLETGTLAAHQRSDYLMQCAPTDYDPHAKAPTFERFVRQIMCDRDPLVAYLQRALGYTITGSVKEQVWHLLVGEGENGKGTLIEAIGDVLGKYDYAGMLEPDSITIGARSTDPNAPSPDIANLKGKRLVKVTETEEGARIAPARIKRLSGGDELRGRHLRHDLLNFMPTFKLWIYTNHRPQARETTHAFWRRVRYIPFDFNLREHPEAKDADLPQKLQAEASGILTWLVQGCLAWQRDGKLIAPPEVTEATEAYKRDSDILQQFIDEHVLAQAQGSTSARAVYGRYTTWCEEMGERPMSQRRLGEALTSRGFERAHMRSGWVWMNLQLTEHE